LPSPIFPVFAASTIASIEAEIVNEDFAISYFSGLRRIHDRLDYLIEYVVIDCHFYLNFRQKVDHVLGPTVELGMAFLSAETLNFNHSHTGRTPSSG
jgi:hypothetical protein